MAQTKSGQAPKSKAKTQKTAASVSSVKETTSKAKPKKTTSASRIKGAASVAAKSKAQSGDIRAFINSLADEGSFIETDTLVVSESPAGEAVGEGVVGGFITLGGTQAAVFATNPAVMKGGIGVGSAEKITRIIKSAVKMNAPLISVIDTSGARFGEGVQVLEGYAKILAEHASAACIPTFCVLKGNNFGMLSYLTANSELNIAFDTAVMATASPLILAGDNKIDVSKVGTASVHAANSGMVDVVVKSVAQLKETICTYLDLTSEPIVEVKDDMNRSCKGLKVGSEVGTVIKEIFDKNSFFELKAAYAPEVVTGLARLGGITVGVVANNGKIDGGRLTAKAAMKIMDLLAVCECYGFPVVNLVDSMGAVVNLHQENCCLIRNIGNMIYSYANLSVGKIALVTGKAIGLGYSALCSNTMCDYTAAWTGAQIGTVSGEAAARLLYGAEIAEAKNKDEAEAHFAAEYAEENMAADKVGALGLLDNVVRPEFSRSFLISAVQAFLSKR